MIMKKLATSLLALAASFMTMAQGPITDISGGPDGYGYSWISSESTIDTVWCTGCDMNTIVSIDTVPTLDDLWFDTIYTGVFTVNGVTFNADSIFMTDTISWDGTSSDTVVEVSSDTFNSDTVAILFYVTSVDTYDTIFGDTVQSTSGTQGPAFEWVDITNNPNATEISGSLADDNSAGPFSIGFDLPFYWYTVDNFHLGSNGYLSFDKGITISSTQDPAFPVFPTDNDNYDNFVAPYLGDLNLGQDFGGQTNPGEIYMYSNNTDTLIVSFIDVPFWNDNNDGWGGANTFQVIFSKVDNSITLNYLSQSGVWNSGYDGDAGATQIGMESVGAIAGLQVASAVYPQDSLAIRITLDPDPTFSVTDVSAAGNNGIKNGGVFASGVQATSFTTNVQNIGTEDINTSFDLDIKIGKSATGGTRYQTSESVASLAAGAVQEINVAQEFNPADPSTLINNATIDLGESYFMTTSFNLGVDDNSTNNRKTSEVAVLNDADPSSVSLSYADNALQNAGQFGFEGGGVYIKPPYYPVDIVSLDFFLITNDANPVGDFTARMWAEDANGSVGTLLAEKIVANTAIVPNFTDNENGITQVFLDAPVTITEGGFYMGLQYLDIAASTFSIAEDVSGGPKSFQNYEILSGVFGEYRSNADADLMMGATMDASNALSTSINEQIENLSIGEVYPNPTSDLASIKVDVKTSSRVSYSIKNVIGQEVLAENLGTIAGQKVINFNVANFESGIYFCTVTIDGESTTKKFTVK